MPTVASYHARTLADLIVASAELARDARLQAGRAPAHVRFTKPVTLSLEERTVGDGAPRRVLTIEVQ